MLLTKAGILAILAFTKASLANIYPDEDPCNPAPALEGEYQGEFDLRMDLAEARCGCEFPPPAPSEQQDEYEERNRIDSQLCSQVPGFQPFNYQPEQWFDPGPLPDMGPIIVPIPVGGFGPSQDWRRRGGWRNPRWRSGGGPGRPGRPGRHFDRRPPKPRGPRGPGRQPFRGNRGRPGGGFNPGPHRDPPRNNPAPHRDPPRNNPAPHISPPRPQPHREPPRPQGHGGRPGHG